MKLISFARSYDQIAGRSEQSIARTTKCLPSCKRSEFETKILPPVDSPSGDVFSGYFFYATGKYVEKSYYYTYDWNSFVADVGATWGCCSDTASSATTTSPSSCGRGARKSVKGIESQ